MKRCDKTSTSTVVTFPYVKPGDTVQLLKGFYKGRVYLVDCNKDLISLETGDYWCRGGGFGTTTNPSDWRKVTCCFSVEDE